MSDALRPVILIFAAAGDPSATALVELFAVQGIESIIATHASQGFLRLCKRAAADPPINTIISVSQIPGMTMPVLAKSIRSMPDLARIPMLLVGAGALSLPLCLSLDPDVDLTVIARLALQEPELWPTEPTPSSGTIPPLPKPTTVILVVDDHEVNLHLVSAQLREVGLPIETCTNGAAAVARVQAGGVALVLMDCQMPIMDGYTATQEIRKLEQNTKQRVPIIAVTAHVMNDNRQQCLNIGMDDFLSKPIEQEHLIQIVRLWLDQLQPNAITPATIPDTTPIVFNPQQLRSIQQSAPDLCARIIAVISDELTLAQQTLSQLLNGNDFPALSKAAHKLKGAAANVGAIEVARMCSALELSAREGDQTASNHHVAMIQEAIIRVRPHLKAFAESTPSQPINKLPA